MKRFLEMLKQALCEHEYHTCYLDSRFRVERENPVRYWVCKCRKCGKVIRVESKRAVL